ncbi:hypothetical protein StoSoilA2_11570 [Arthrobacter sp. StoSoilA2]|nr:hypothetical protein StoSoilA2_11570 [Arthrobacter sp. StoSoilA2]
MFTKAQLREAFPGVEQIDRRMRDLRQDGWILSTYAQERALAVDELRLVKIGGHIWEPGYKSNHTPRASDRERRETLARDNFACIFCGIGAGETYSDDPALAGQLNVTWCDAAAPRGRYVTTCKRCRNPLAEIGSSDVAYEAAETLVPDEMRLLMDWIRVGHRTPRQIDRVWGLVRLLSKGERENLLTRLEELAN